MVARTKESKALTVIDRIEDSIYLIRGERVMLDSDLAELYGVTTKRLKEQVRRNISRFPKDFVFELTLEETRGVESLRSQIATLDRSKRGKYSKYGAFAFTEHGAVMLASVLNSETAVDASIAVVRAFVKMRQMIEIHKELADRIRKLEKTTESHGRKFAVVSQLLSEILRDPKYLKKNIGFAAPSKKLKK